jgi:hypothetical protein
LRDRYAAAHTSDTTISGALVPPQVAGTGRAATSFSDLFGSEYYLFEVNGSEYFCCLILLYLLLSTFYRTSPFFSLFSGSSNRGIRVDRSVIRFQVARIDRGWRKYGTGVYVILKRSRFYSS